jgi:hypothetical protein
MACPPHLTGLSEPSPGPRKQELRPRQHRRGRLPHGPGIFNLQYGMEFYQPVHAWVNGILRAALRGWLLRDLSREACPRHARP